MNTSKLADISEIVSSMAIVATLIFLAIQMQHNTRAIEASSRQDTQHADAEFLRQITNRPDIYLAYTKPELTDEETVSVFMSLAHFVRNREHLWIQLKLGAIDTESWTRFEGSLIAVLSYQRTRNWWINYGLKTFHPEFVQAVNEILERSPVTTDTVQERMDRFLGDPDEFQLQTDVL